VDVARTRRKAGLGWYKRLGNLLKTVGNIAIL
jgi:hypothetical protein